MLHETLKELQPNRKTLSLPKRVQLRKKRKREQAGGRKGEGKEEKKRKRALPYKGVTKKSFFWNYALYIHSLLSSIIGNFHSACRIEGVLLSNVIDELD